MPRVETRHQPAGDVAARKRVGNEHQRRPDGFGAAAADSPRPDRARNVSTSGSSLDVDRVERIAFRAVRRARRRPSRRRRRSAFPPSCIGEAARFGRQLEGDFTRLSLAGVRRKTMTFFIATPASSLGESRRSPARRRRRRPLRRSRPLPRAGGGAKLSKLGLRPVAADRQLQREIGERRWRDRLFLRAHDAFERRVSRFAERQGRRQERGSGARTV